ncbi:MULTISPECIES: CAP domain-containing protein [Thalassobacillus]|uniref:CAP domain-containing protein n=1 Tax=Thalassobacillus TaxID=331971 RepID=UPI000A1C8B86|nr:CAP domain-containing protein [Thalassobacillus devorans]
MFKKVSTAFALSTALLMGGAFTADAHAGGEQQAPSIKAFYKIQSYGGSFSQDDVNKLLQDALNKYDIQWDQLQTPKQEQPKEQPKQEQPKEQPKQEEPAEKEQAPEQPAEKQEASEQPAEEQQQAPAPQQQEQTQEAPAEEQSAEQNSELSQFEQQVVELTNQERQKQGLEPLKADAELSKVARDKSKDMATNGYFSHNSPTHGSPFDMMKAYGIDYRTAGENIAKGQRSPEEVVNGWMNSEGHRKNIMNPNFTHIGVGYVENGNVWTQMFIGK